MNKKPEFKLRSRQDLERIEDQTLAFYATRSREVHATRQHEESEHLYRTAFQRDRDRIVHSRAFRRLKHKRQVFLTHASDHYRTRMTHTLEVSQLSRTMARALGLNEDLVEAIALGHDLGHTPFGHLGEVVLNEIMTGKSTFAGQNDMGNLGGFKHNYQSLRVVDYLEKKYKFRGLNLTAPVREGILKHTRLKRGELNYPDFCYAGLKFEQDAASTLEGQVVAICDEIAQRTHDLEDGIRAGLVDIKQVRVLDIVKNVEEKFELVDLIDQDIGVYTGLMIKGLINELVDDVIAETLERLAKIYHERKDTFAIDQEIVRFSPSVNKLQSQLNKFIYKEIIKFSRVNWADEMGEKLLRRLFEVYFTYPHVLPSYVIERYFGEKNTPFSAGWLQQKEKILELQNDGKYFRLICDHIAGMTDNFAVQEAGRLSRLHKMQIVDLQLDHALGENTQPGEGSTKKVAEHFEH